MPVNCVGIPLAAPRECQLTLLAQYLKFCGGLGQPVCGMRSGKYIFSVCCYIQPKVVTILCSKLTLQPSFVT